MLKSNKNYLLAGNSYWLGAVKPNLAKDKVISEASLGRGSRVRLIGRRADVGPLHFQGVWELGEHFEILSL